MQTRSSSHGAWRTAIAVATAAQVALIASTGAAQEKKAAGGASQEWFAEAVSHGDLGVAITHFWSKGSRFRAETVAGGHRVVTIVSGPLYYAVDALSGTGVIVERDSRAVAADATRGRPFGREARSIIAQGERVGTEKLQDRECDVYRLTDESGKRTVYVTRDAAELILRAEVAVRSGQKIVTDFLNWTADLGMPDTWFEPDPRWKLERYDLATYMRKAAEGPVGPVPVLYEELLRARN
jgi:outer membrane lipoprotein-sorting protein